jgi:hypothetical protein
MQTFLKSVVELINLNIRLYMGMFDLCCVVGTSGFCCACGGRAWEGSALRLVGDRSVQARSGLVHTFRSPGVPRPVRACLSARAYSIALTGIREQMLAILM